MFGKVFQNKKLRVKKEQSQKQIYFTPSEAKNVG